MFPISLNIGKKIILLAGAGLVGRRKLGKIMAAGALVRLLEPKPTDEIRLMAEQGLLELFENYHGDLLEGVSLLFAATDNPAFNRFIARAAQEKGIWANIADSPELSDFILPAVVEQGPFKLAVSTGGGSPALAAKVAGELRATYGPQYGRLALLMAALRPLTLSSGLDISAREKTFKRLLDSSELVQALVGGDDRKALTIIGNLIKPAQLPLDFRLPLLPLPLKLAAEN